MRRHRLGVPALLVAGGYLVTVLAAAVSALVSGDVRLLWRLTLFYELEEEPEPTLSRLLSGLDTSASWPKVLVLLATGGLWAWALWQSLRGPVSGPRPASDRSGRPLRVMLYASVACWMVYLAAPEWPWWASVLELLVTLGVVVAFHPLLRPLTGLAGLALAAGVTANVLQIAVEIFYALGWRGAGRMIESTDLAAVANLVWLVIVLMAQWRGGRWHRTTVMYGVASLIAPVALVLVGIPLTLVEGLKGVYGEVVAGASSALMVTWLARSAHDLARPDDGHAPPRPAALPSPAPPYRLVVSARLAACVIPLVPALVNLTNGHLLWITPHVPVRQLARRVGDVLPAIWWSVEAAAGVGGVTLLVLIAGHRGTRRTFRVAMTGLLLTAAAGFVPVAGVAVLLWLRGDGPFSRLGGDLYTRVAYFARGAGAAPAVSPLWFTAACLLSAVILWWAHVVRSGYGKGVGLVSGP
ncbi:hypothetical protein ACIBKY_52665 [Nonomuraea sp. NPDC050394]|uniref:hypothetical protein n=1 Tax=Nonomuraea sp. NPDC050394 TaxID=3364363 RepID=UPI0037A18407